jgi:hypothetical protein
LQSSTLSFFRSSTVWSNAREKLKTTSRSRHRRSYGCNVRIQGPMPSNLLGPTPSKVTSCPGQQKSNKKYFLRTGHRLGSGASTSSLPFLLVSLRIGTVSYSVGSDAQMFSLLFKHHSSIKLWRALEQILWISTKHLKCKYATGLLVKS